MTGARVDVAANLARVQDAIANAAKDNGRAPEDVRLVAVSKTQGAAHIAPALEAGHRLFGENRVQEAAGKWPGLRSSYADVRMHLIGPLQTNKVKQAVALFDTIETVDRLKLARALSKEMAQSGRRLDCYIEVNLGEEAQKAGVPPADVDDFVALCLGELDLPVVGLMCIPPLGEEPGPYFALLAKIAERNNLPRLSMGMSADYETAIAFGATDVRVGTAIFGPRQPRDQSV